MKLLMGLALSLAMVNPVFSAVSTSTATEPAPGKPLEDAPHQLADRSTVVSVVLEGTDSLGARLSTRLKERFNHSTLFHLTAGEDSDTSGLRLLINTTPEFPGRPTLGSVYGICWVFSQGKGYLGYLLGREVGTVNAEDLDSLVDKLVERTDGIAAKYSKLLK